MYGSIVVMADENGIRAGNLYSPYESYELRSRIPGCDYVFEDEDEKEFREAIQSLIERYSLPEIPIMELDDEQIHSGILEAAHIKALKKGLKQRVAERIERIRQEVNRPDPSLWNIAREAYCYSPFYFIDPEQGFFNEVEFAQHLDGDGEKLYITETFKYHL